ncbi:endospore germination permease [Paenibacillus sp. HN-1]|uniref:GerAB/ArcD/ProY family transporter n=1 Tax=Paenibacillus TaxID=44249 RepID=UPI001CAA07E6|nr:MULTISPECIES: endospore germination permease [Paenibacillus]MBY9079895.1 endospore germination permease [Paenibacillus sp. CGMCC 1.18879]MBY9084536.1 endospore germination permease [Paenibacillus sinensis]
MSKEIIPGGQSIASIVLFCMGGSLFLGNSGASGNSAWIGVLIAMALACPLMLLYARLQALLPGKNLYGMLESVFGKLIGKSLSCLFIGYAMYLGAIALRDFGEFSKTIALTATPMLVPMMGVGLLGIWVAHSGIEVMGRTSKFLFLVAITGLVIVLLLSIPNFNPHYLKPLLDKGWRGIFIDAATTFAFPFGEVVLFLGVFDCLSAKTPLYKALLGGFGIAGLLMLAVTLRNLLVLGPEVISSLYFPSYVAVSRIDIGDFLERIEGSSAIIFVTALFVKVSVCIYVAARGIAHLFNLKSYRSVVLQTGLIMILFADFVYKNIMDMVYFSFHIYKVFAFPFQVLLPAALLAGAEIAARRGRLKKETAEK